MTGSELRKARERAGWSMERLAREADISYATVFRYETDYADEDLEKSNADRFRVKAVLKAIKKANAA